MTELSGQIAVVTGATRGCGRGIAVELGARGATVYVTGRSVRGRPSELNRPETIEETAELVNAAGGTGISVYCDFTSSSDVAALAHRIEEESAGQLDILVDDVWGGDPFVEHEVPFWESDIDQALLVLRNGVETHLRAVHGLIPLMVRRGQGLLIEVTDQDDDAYYGTALPYYLVKSCMRRVGQAMGSQLQEHGVTALALTPGFLRSEAMLEHFGVTEDTWRDAVAHDRHFGLSETPHYIGRSVAALAVDRKVSRWSGKTTSTWELMREYGFTDVDGSQPDWGRYFTAAFGQLPNARAEDYR